MVTQTEMLIDWFKTNKQVREQIDDEKDRELSESLKSEGQLQPVVARPDGTLIVGHRRLRAARRAGLTKLLVNIIEEPLTETQVKILQLAENIHRTDLSDFEKFQACEELARLNPGWTNKELATHLHLSEPTITKYRSPSKAIPAVLKALEAGQVGITSVYEIAKAPPEQQAELLQLALTGASRDGLAGQVRKQKTSNTPQVRMKRILCPLPSGVSITVSGADLSLDDLIESLSDALKEARRAREQNLDARTFSSVLKDKAAKQGGAR
ncbi:MAG: ParB/RepB/Spo0J family partition protein [Planctomycetaceae bacterium]|nr:ParB/RepB/Spo0J family partition protein [Planctomycetaceae bacterium]